MRIVVLSCSVPDSKHSYNDDWLDAFLALEHKKPGIRVLHHNLLQYSRTRLVADLLTADGVIALHSTNSNEFAFSPLLISILRWRRGKLVVFVGNEFKLIPDKIKLLKQLKADFVASQLPQDTADWLYEGGRYQVVSVPHALNLEIFQKRRNRKDRPLDIGVRAARYPLYLGDRDRIGTIAFFGSDQPELRNFKRDISLDANQRYTREGWSDFLNSARFTVSTEAGTSFLERDDRTRVAVNAYMNLKPDATFEEVFERFFAGYSNPISGKAISSRHFDAIGCHTAQLLMRGRYNDLLIEDRHYFGFDRTIVDRPQELRELLDRMRDEQEVSRMCERAFEEVGVKNTHGHRVDFLLEKIGLN
jgi:hypothetical protein